MYGYVYRITVVNENSSFNGCTYIGQHKYSGDSLDPTYYGSSKILSTNYISKYGTNGMVIKGVLWAYSKEQLNELEKLFILIERKINGNKCLNRTKGGIGGSTFEFLTKEEQYNYRKKIKEIGINRYKNNQFERNRISELTKLALSSPEKRKKISNGVKNYYNKDGSREKASIRTTNRYKNNNERIKTSHLIKKSLSDPEKRKNISNKIKEKYNDPEYLNKRNNSLKGNKFWNNGILQTFTKECPGDGWVNGRIYDIIPKDWKIYNNGIFNVRYKECPEGFVEGRHRNRNYLKER